MTAPLLEVRDLSVEYRCGGRPVEHLSFALWPSEILCLRGRSGAGKSTVVNAIMGLLSEFGARAWGEILYQGADLLSCGAQTLSRLRWREIALVPQSSMSVFNPVYTLRRTLREMLLLSDRTLSDAACRAREEELAELVHLDRRALDQYPHELSGGMKQRAAIALAVVYHPKLLLLDEATTGLDIKIQADVLGTILQLKRREDMTLLFISHDKVLGDQFCDRRVELP